MDHRIRLSRYVRIALIAIGLQLSATPPALAEDITGTARVIDGDTIDIDGI